MLFLAVLLVLGLVWPKGSKGWGIGLAYVILAYTALPFVQLYTGAYRGVDVVLAAYFLLGIGLIIWAFVRRRTSPPISRGDIKPN